MKSGEGSKRKRSGGLKSITKAKLTPKRKTTAQLERERAALDRQIAARKRSEEKAREKVERRIERLTYRDVEHGDLPSVRPGEKPKRLVPGRTKKKTERAAGERFGLPYYKDAVHKLRRLGVPGFDADDLSLSRIRKDADLPGATARKIERAMSRYDHLFARPHIIKRYGSTKHEKAKLAAAQVFGGHFVVDPRLKGASIPVATRDPKKVRVRHRRSGEVFVEEEIAGQVTETYDIPLDRVQLARRPMSYLTTLLESFPDSDRFVIGAGSSVINQSLSKKHLVDHVAGLMKRYDEKTLQGGQLVYSNSNWRNWLLSLKREHIRGEGRGYYSAIDMERGAAMKGSRATRAELMSEQRREADAERKKRARLTKRMRLKGRQ